MACEPIVLGLMKNNMRNEAPFAEAVSSHFQTQHQTVIASSDIMDLLPALIGKLDEPLTDTSFLVTYQVSELAKRDVKVVLSGLGGDELFAGYGRYLAPGITGERLGFHGLGESSWEKLWRVRCGLTVEPC